MGADWALTVDPDEWLEMPGSELMAIRRMAESSTRQAWLFRFRNLRSDGTANLTSAVPPVAARIAPTLGSV